MNNYRIGEGFVVEGDSSHIEVVVEEIGDKNSEGHRNVLFSIKEGDSRREELADTSDKRVDLRNNIYFVVSGRQEGRGREITLEIYASSCYNVFELQREL